MRKGMRLKKWTGRSQRRISVRVLCMVCVCVCMCVCSSTVHAQSLGAAARTVSESKRTMDYLESNYLNKELIEAEFKVESRLNEARVAYELKKYDNAASLFLDVVSRTGPELESYRTALFYLSDSLFKIRNVIGARGYLRKLIKLGKGPYFQESLRKLLEIAYETRNYDGVDEVYAMLDAQSSSNLSASVNYLRGKTLNAQKKFSDARIYFEKAASGSERLAPQARYFSAVTLVSEKKLDEALTRFGDLIKGKPQTPEAKRVRLLSFLSMGRLHFEAGRFSESIDFYNRIPQESDLFVAAMYEATWALVQLKEYIAARDNVELITTIDPNPKTYTRAMLLRADIALRIKEYDVALDSFQDILDRYDPVKTQIDEFVATHQNLEVFFQGLVKDDLTLSVPQGLPVIRTDFVAQSPQEWLSEGSLLNKTKTMIGDVATMREDIRQSLKIVDEIEVRLASNSRVEAFPKIAEGIARSVELETQLLQLRRVLLERELDLLKPSLSTSVSAQIQTLESELRLLDKSSGEIPGTLDALNERQEKVDNDFKRLRQRVDDLGYVIDNLRAELAAVDIYMRTQSVPLPQEEVKKVAAMREELRHSLKILEEQRQALRKEVELVRRRVDTGSVISNDERSTRVAWRKKMAQISDALVSHHGNISSDELFEIQTYRQEIASLEARTQGFHDKMYQVADRKLDDIRHQVANERKLLTTHAQSIDAMIKTSREVAGGLAYQNFLSKKQQFEQTVLRSDVGTIDVLYHKKEDSTKEINTLFKQRTEALQTLQESFDELR